jgi:hypothetical protein
MNNKRKMKKKKEQTLLLFQAPTTLLNKGNDYKELIAV